MLEELKILNGQLDLSFDKYINTYTVSVKEEINKLEISYKATEGFEVEILNNELSNHSNIVYIRVFNDTKNTTYTLEVFKEETNKTAMIEEYKKTISVKQKEIPLWQTGLIGGTCLLILVILFIFLFKKRKNK